MEQYRFILRLEPNATALYNLGSLCAQGRGTPRDFCEAAYYFRRAAEAGDERAAKLVLKCELDYIREGLESRSAGELYERMKAFSALAYPGDAPDARAARELSQLGQHHYNRPRLRRGAEAAGAPPPSSGATGKPRTAWVSSTTPGTG